MDGCCESLTHLKKVHGDGERMKSSASGLVVGMMIEAEAEGRGLPRGAGRCGN
jgi:hypothetical protein